VPEEILIDVLPPQARQGRGELPKSAILLRAAARWGYE